MALFLAAATVFAISAFLTKSLLSVGLALIAIGLFLELSR